MAKPDTKKPKTRTPSTETLRAPPINPAGRLAAQTSGALQQAANSVVPNPAKLLSGDIDTLPIGDWLLGDTTGMLDRWSKGRAPVTFPAYGSKLVNAKFDPAIIDALSVVAPGVKPAILGAKTLGRSAKHLAPDIASMAERYALPMQAYAVPPETGRAAFLKLKAEQLDPQKEIIDALKAADVKAHLDAGRSMRTYWPSEGLQAEISNIKPVEKAGGGIAKAAGKGLRGLAEKYRLAHEVAQKNAALPVSKGGLGLPPDNTALDRAKALGFDIYNKYFHGTGDDFTEFDPNSFFTTKPHAASTYAEERGITYAIDMHGDPLKAANVMPVYIKAKKVADYENVEKAAKKHKVYDPEMEMGSYYYTSPNMDNFSAKAAPLVLKDLKKKGFDAVEHYDYDMDGNEMMSMQILEPNQIRSTSAAFDPFRRGEADILAGVGIGLPISGVVNQEPVKKAHGGPVHMDEGGLWEGYGAPVEKDTQKRQSAYYPQQGQSVRVMPSGSYKESESDGVSQSNYRLGADIDILNKYGFGVTKEGQVIKLPERSYTFDDGYTETQPARKIKHSDISELRARYATDDGIEYGIARQPMSKGWSGYRRNNKDNSSVGVSVSPYYTGVNYTKNFAEGGLVHSEFNFDEINNYADGGIVTHNDFNYGEISKMADQLVGSMYG